jgi:DNA-binding NarL/FixJ family response regulator
MVRILIADDHAIFREALRALLDAEPDFDVVGEASDGRDVVPRVNELDPDILLLDLSMPGLNGIESLRQLSKNRTRTRTVLLTAAIEDAQLLEALQLGARGLVLKDAATSVLLRGIRGVMKGQYWIGHDSVGTLIDALHLLPGSKPRPAGPRDLSERELQVVAGVVAGCGNRELAARLGISEKTVKHHLTNIFQKVGVTTRLELAVFALDRHLELPDIGAS